MEEPSTSSLECSSSVEEIELLKSTLEYRRDWLEAILFETALELKKLLNVEELTAENSPDIVFQDAELPILVNQLSQSFIDFMRGDAVTYETPEEKQKVYERLQYQSSILRSLLHHLELQLGVAVETLDYLTSLKES